MSAKTDALRGALETIERILNRGGDSDDVLRAVVETIERRLPHVDWAGLRFVEGDELVLGPAAGAGPGPVRLELPVHYDGRRVGRLDVAGGPFDQEDEDFVARVATLISAHTLLAWDTGGEAWDSSA
jgi:putative methionine-R-sulfoxide reductase with GAF domain